MIRQKQCPPHLPRVLVGGKNLTNTTKPPLLYFSTLVVATGHGRAKPGWQQRGLLINLRARSALADDYEIGRGVVAGRHGAEPLRRMTSCWCRGCAVKGDWLHTVETDYEATNPIFVLRWPGSNKGGRGGPSGILQPNLPSYMMKVVFDLVVVEFQMTPLSGFTDWHTYMLLDLCVMGSGGAPPQFSACWASKGCIAKLRFPFDSCRLLRFLRCWQRWGISKRV